MQRYFFIFLILNFTFLGCTQNKNTAEKTLPSIEQKTPDVSAISQKTFGNTILSGMVTFSGKVPQEPNNPARSFAECNVGVIGDRHKSFRIQSEKIENVFVYVKGGLREGQYPPPSEPVLIKQEKCAYIPRVLGVQVGQPLRVHNGDPMLHNVHSQAKNSPNFNIGQPTIGMEFTKTFIAPEVMVTIKCDVHGWMRAYVGVLSHPFFDVTKSDGSFKISRLPQGIYTLEAWHEKLGTKTQKVTISSDEAKTITFEFQSAQQP